MTNAFETKKVQRNNRKVVAWRITETGPMSCGHVQTVTTEWHTENDGTRGAAVEIIARFERPCVNCNIRALGGGHLLND